VPDLKAQVAGRRLVVRCGPGDAFRAVRRRAGERVLESDPGLMTLTVACDGQGSAIRGLLDELDPDRDAIADFSVRTASLDDVFLTLTGHTATSESESTDE
jgi:ABC-2 type transport system ATP-binding protein